MIPIKTLGSLDATVRMPGSKSYTQRAMVISALARGVSTLYDGLLSEDTLGLVEALRLLGIDIQTTDSAIVIHGKGGKFTRPPHEIRLGNNGTAIRLLTGMVSLAKGPFVLTGDPRLCERPMKPLLDALTLLGVEIDTNQDKGYPPITLRGGSLRGGEIILKDIRSSQFVSSLLIIAPFAKHDTTIILKGRIPSLPYISMTIDAMNDFGVLVFTDTSDRYVVPCRRCYIPREYRIEGDASSASYFFLAAAMLKGRIRVQNINHRTRQGDIGFLSILERLGCTVLRKEHYIEVRGGDMPSGEIIFDLGEMPDIVPTLAMLCAMRRGKSVIRNVAHLRLKESDRLASLATELRKTGVTAEEIEDGLVIDGGNPNGARIETYHDHRIAMSFAVLGLAVPGMEIEGEECVGKSFPGFWDTLECLYGTVKR